MNSGKYVFSGLVEFLPQKEFYKMVKRYNADKWTKRVSCWNQLLLMMFGQLSGCDSLRELACIVAAHQKKSYHLGFGKGIIARSTLEYANAHRDYRLYEEFAYYMTSLAQSKRIDREFVLNGQAKDIAMLYKQRWQVVLFFPLDKAASPGEVLLGQYRECGENTDLRRHHHILPRGYCRA